MFHLCGWLESDRRYVLFVMSLKPRAYKERLGRELFVPVPETYGPAQKMGNIPWKIG